MALTGISLHRRTDNHFAITATNLGLYSTMGPLPTLYTEDLLEEARCDKSVSRDFLDILNNHLAHLRYAANQHHNLECRTVEQASQKMWHFQLSLIGQAHIAFEENLLPKAYLTEIFAHRTRSAAQLEMYLSYVLDRNDIRIEQCVERKTLIPEDQCCRLGLANSRLRENCMLGKISSRQNGALPHPSFGC